MFGLSKVLRMGEGRKIKRLQKIAEEVLALEPEMADLTDEELKAKTDEFKERIANGETVDDLLYEAFAVAREASYRVLGQKHYLVQVMGGAALHFGGVAEMRTGEGKTLTCVLPAYLNALEGKGVHVVTVNDYLAKRDAEWMGRVHRFLGLKVGVILSNMTPEERKTAYDADITYGTNNELGFDYLRDNMVHSLSELVQRGHHYAIVDEVDSILIDEARTPLIISGPADGPSQLYTTFAALAPRMREGIHYEVDHRKRTVGVKEEGVEFVENQLGIENLYAPENSQLVSYLNNAIKAKELFTKDKDYIVSKGEVLIVDDFTGRVLEGRRYNEGMHQAIEAKECVEIKNENQTLATITLQNYFRLYDKLAGMTGTAETEAAELHQIYKLDVMPIPTNKKPQREDMTDLVYKTQEAKFAAVVQDIAERVAKGQPVLVGTTSVERSEYLSKLLQRRHIKHNVLNAKFHEQEAQIIARAGLPGQVTVATNMAGRGTDIKLTDEVRAAGGLAIIGTERHDSRRVDRQLRGRAGRQGDVGSSVFFVSLEDKLMRLFASERIARVMDKLGFKDGEMIESGMISKSIERAQKKVEENNFGTRKHLLEYDDVMNKQRTVIYEKRRHALMGERIGMDISNMIWDRVVDTIDKYDYAGCVDRFIEIFAMQVPFTEEEFEGMKREDLYEKAFDAAIQTFNRKMEKLREVAIPVIKQVYETQAEQFDHILVPISDGRLVYNVRVDLKEAYETESRNVVREFEKAILLHNIDDCWKENLRLLDELKHSVRNVSYEQKDPLVVFKIESVKLFDDMVNDINDSSVSTLMRAFIPGTASEEVRDGGEEEPRSESHYTETKQEFDESGELVDVNEAQAQAGAPDQLPQQPLVKDKMPGRNDPCPCGSGKKFKNCHGKGIV